MKIIDFDRIGNLVRFYLGSDNCNDYCGHGWDISPYECNAFAVHRKYVVGYIDICFPHNYSVLEPCDCNFAHWTKYDMKHGVVPCIVAVPECDVSDFASAFCNAQAKFVFFNDSYDKLVSMLSGYIVDTEIYYDVSEEVELKSHDGGESK